MNQETYARLKWIKHYQSCGNLVSLVIVVASRPTLRKWLKRYEKDGPSGFVSRNCRPKRSPNTKVFCDQEQQVISLRQENNLGARRIQNELKRRQSPSLSLATIHKVLASNKVKPLRRPKREKKVHRYSRPIPGERVQLDNCEIVPGTYQYTRVNPPHIPKNV